MASCEMASATYTAAAAAPVQITALVPKRSMAQKTRKRKKTKNGLAAPCVR